MVQICFRFTPNRWVKFYSAFPFYETWGSMCPLKRASLRREREGKKREMTTLALGKVCYACLTFSFFHFYKCKCSNKMRHIKISELVRLDWQLRSRDCPSDIYLRSHLVSRLRQKTKWTKVSFLLRVARNVNCQNGVKSPKKFWDPLLYVDELCFYVFA